MLGFVSFGLIAATKMGVQVQFDYGVTWPLSRAQDAQAELLVERDARSYALFVSFDLEAAQTKGDQRMPSIETSASRFRLQSRRRSLHSGGEGFGHDVDNRFWRLARRRASFFCSCSRACSSIDTADSGLLRPKRFS